ncbi:acyl-CoA dehydrogenase like protein [Zymoseptoria brevis]|uniref:Acyl-CoA dehydrogenase like protein n=1 Tax=Zymoseptoria brevis TaxID=1047168 RepID=A0A0F4GCJ7_9PEZI|nr:acyl-CoA dehydrogenase like protein [Zymoseptoria brevis]
MPSAPPIPTNTTRVAIPPSVPFAEPPWAQGLPSYWLTPELKQYQQRLRAFISENLTQHAWEWDKEETVPAHVFDTFAKANMLVPALPAPLPVKELHAAGIHEVMGVKVEDFTAWHNYLYGDEMIRSGLTGPGGSLTTGMAFGVPPIIKFGNEQLKQRFLPDLLTGRKRTCIAITEPDAGSDVANIRTTAVKSKDGKHYIINGRKKWITNGIWSDTAAMAVRTGGSGPGGLSMIVVPLKGQKGVDMRRLKVSGQVSAGTTFIELDDVEVPVENLIGEEGQGMRYIMTNFNHERMSIAIGVTRQSRVVLSAAFEYVLKREAFGKTLFEQPVVRHRLAKAGALVESLSAWVEQFVYQLTIMKKEDADVELGGLTAGVKAHAGMVMKECADCAVLLFGGNGYTRTGQGEIAERMWREVNGNRVPGGSEDVMLDLMVRQLGKNFQRKTALLEKSQKSKM